jgi:hypothetical protein
MKWVKIECVGKLGCDNHVLEGNISLEIFLSHTMCVEF